MLYSPEMFTSFESSGKFGFTQNFALNNVNISDVAVWVDLFILILVLSLKLHRVEICALKAPTLSSVTR